jgi:hypothetical protein
MWPFASAFHSEDDIPQRAGQPLERDWVFEMGYGSACRGCGAVSTIRSRLQYKLHGIEEVFHTLDRLGPLVCLGRHLRCTAGDRGDRRFNNSELLA